MKRLILPSTLGLLALSLIYTLEFSLRSAGPDATPREESEPDAETPIEPMEWLLGSGAVSVRSPEPALSPESLPRAAHRPALRGAELKAQLSRVARAVLSRDPGLGAALRPIVDDPDAAHESLRLIVSGELRALVEELCPAWPAETPPELDPRPSPSPRVPRKLGTNVSGRQS